jgi:hypothetical protein
VVEHAGAKQLIAQIQGMSPEDDYFEAKVTVLSAMIKHHVKEEEQPGGMFAEAKKSEMNLTAVGEELLARKRELQSHSKAAERGRHNGNQTQEQRKPEGETGHARKKARDPSERPFGQESQKSQAGHRHRAVRSSASRRESTGQKKSARKK